MDKEKSWVDRISENTLSMVTLVLMFSTLAVNASGFGYMFKTVFFSGVLCTWVALGIIYTVKWKRNRKMDEEKPR